MTQAPIHELPATPLFAGLDNEDWPDLLGISVRLELGVGEPVFREGAPADAFFVLLKGLVEVRAKMKTGNAEKALAHLGTGAVLGETSLFLGGQHSASIYAAEPSTLLQFRNEGFLEMIRTRHRGAIQVLYNMGHTLAVRLRAADAEITAGAAAAAAAPGGIIGNADKARKIFGTDYA